MQEFGIGGDLLPTFQVQLAFDFRALKLCLMDLHDVMDDLGQLDRPKLRLRHSREFTEASDDRFQICNFGEQSGSTLAKTFVELLRAKLTRAKQILNRQVQWEQRILEFVRQTPRQLTPRRNSLSLHQTILLVQELVRHAIERLRKFADF